MRNIIFHLPFKINPQLSSGTNLRPMKMLQAFKDLGYNVDFIMGTARERTAQIKEVKTKIKSGLQYDFLYAENSTLPTLLTETHHLPSYPFLDFGFLKFCKKNHIPIGQFYRDIFWNFDAYSLKGIKAKYTRTMYRYDLKKYNKLVDVFFLPSLEMAKYIPSDIKPQIQALPPGHDCPLTKSPPPSNDTIKLFYVGGLSSHYQMEKLFEAVKGLKDIQLTVCTRKEEWEKAKNGNYNKYTNAENIRIVHKQSHELAGLYEEADIAMLFVRPFEYWQFAVPIKLFEYIGHKKPIIASANSFCGKFVQKNDIGWTIPYEVEALNELLCHLKTDRNLIIFKQSKLEKVHAQNSWQARAQKVAILLTKV